MNPTQAEAAKETPAATSSVADTQTSQPDLGDASLEQLDELMTTGKVTLAPKPGGGGQEAPKGEAKAEAPKVETPAAGEQPPVTETTTTETPTPPAETPTPPAETPTPPAAPKGEEETAERFRFKDPQIRAALAIVKAREAAGTPISLAEAERLVVGEPTAPVTAEAVIEAEPIVVEAKGNIETLTKEIADLETEIEEAGKNESLMTTEVSQAIRTLSKKQGDLVRAEGKLERAQETAKTQLASRETEATRHKTARLESRTSAIELYPDVADENTALGKAVAAEFEAMKDANHPDNPILFADSAPEIVTERVAKKLGIQPKAKAKAAATPVQPATQVQTQPPRKAVSPPSGGKTSVPVVQPAEDAQKTIEHLQSPEATLEELDAAFGAGNPAAVLAAAVR